MDLNEEVNEGATGVCDWRYVYNNAN